MGLITKEVEIILNARTVKRYEEKGYKIPRKKDKRNRLIVPKGTKIMVKVEDLTEGSHALVNCECDECKKQLNMFWYTYKKHNHNGKVYCHSCSLKILNSRENNPNWNLNKTDEERKNERKYTEYTNFIKSVLARDDYTCQCCGRKISDKLEVHHLDGYNWCIEKRIDVTNGITLCNNCHDNFHLKYGRGYNTKKQFEEWFGVKDLLLDEYNGKLPNSKWAYCISDNKIIKNIPEYSTENNLNCASVYKCCNGEMPMYKSKIYIWYDIYKKMKQDEIDEYIKRCKSNYRIKEVVCVNYKLLFDSAKNAGMYFGICHSGITACCKKRLKSTGKSSTGEKLIWSYASDIENICEYKYVSKEKCEEYCLLNTKFEGETEVVL